MNHDRITVAVLGAGNMAGAIAQSLASSTHVARIRLTTRTATVQWAAPLSHVEHRCLAQDPDATTWALDGADVVILGVKPYQVVDLCGEIAPRLHSATLVVSVAAGVTLDAMRQALGADVSVVRSMPNTPTAIGRGVTAVSGTPTDTAGAVALLAPTGLVEVIDESLMDAFAAVAGSGPAYAYAFVEALEKAAGELGFAPDLASRLVPAMMAGALTYLEASDHDAAYLREQVTSPGGSTAQALQVFAERDLEGMVVAALKAARRRNEEMGA